MMCERGPKRISWRTCYTIRCDDISVQNMVRLGRHDSSQQTSRTMKVVLSSKEQRDKVLSQAKKLVWEQDVREGVYTTGLDSKAKAEETRAGETTKTEKGKWGIELDNSPTQVCHQKVEVLTGNKSLRCFCTNTNANNIIIRCLNFEKK